MFATAGDPFDASNLAALFGTAEYVGRAEGVYATTTAVDSFAADVELSADFGSASELGTINGRVFNIALDSGNPSPLEEIGLLSDHWIEQTEAHNIFTAPDWEAPGALYHGGLIHGNISAAEGWWGNWGGVFGGNGNAATDHPASIAGDLHGNTAVR